jgi:hypothetical protein
MTESYIENHDYGPNWGKARAGLDKQYERVFTCLDCFWNDSLSSHFYIRMNLARHHAEQTGHTLQLRVQTTELIRVVK